MRGKKSDPAFIAEFIEVSVQNGVTTPGEMVQRAKEIISQIDREIKAIEERKALRSKLLDVVSVFEKSNKDHSEEARLLDFFRLSDPRTCKLICDMVKVNPIDKSGNNLDPDVRFSIKQLLECRVLSRTGEQIAKGERFDEYMTFVLREGR